MNRDFDPTLDPAFDPRLAEWLESDPDHAPDAILEIVLAALPSIQQRRAWRVPWRFHTMNRFAPIGAAAAIAIVLVGGTLLLLTPRSGDVGTPPAASPTASSPPSTPPPSPSASPSLAACSLVTSDEAEQLAGVRGLGALPTESGAGNETTCIYRDGGGNIVLRVMYTKSGGSGLFEAAQNASGAQAVADIGDGAVFDPETATLSFVQGDSLVSIVAGTSSQAPANRLATERAIGRLAAERVQSMQ